MFQQDSNLKQTAKAAPKWVENHKVKILDLERPSQSPDLSPIKTLWLE